MLSPVNIKKEGYCIFIDALCEGRTPLEFDENDLPIVYSTIHEAQKSIVEDRIEKLHQFLAGKRDFDDAVTVEEYVIPVRQFSDGSVVEIESKE